MLVIKVIAFLIVALYFLFRLVSGIYMYATLTDEKLERVKAQVPLVTSKRDYIHGIIEHTIFLVLTCLIYFI